MSIAKLDIFIKFSKEEIQLGQLVLDGSSVLFKYADDYLKTGYNISPFKLKFDASIQENPRVPFGGLFGVFSDSLPDAWGQLLLRRYLNSKGLILENINSLDQLSYVGANGLGALIYRPSNNRGEKNVEVDLDNLYSNISEVLKGESSKIIDQLFEYGGSPGGARPKIYASYNKAADTLIYDNSIFTGGYENWILKFAATVDSNEIANIEMAYYYMALDAGLKMSTCKLFHGKSGKTYFGTKRFDRIGTNRLHMISVAGLLHDNYQQSQIDYGTIMQQGSELVGSAQVHEQILRQASFNIFAHNRDDHSKNFAFLMDEKGVWSFAPSYDLTFSSSSQGQHSTTCSGNGIDPGTKELLELASHFSIKKGKDIIAQVKDVVSNWKLYADKAEVSFRGQKSIDKVLQSLVVK